MTQKQKTSTPHAGEGPEPRGQGLLGSIEHWDLVALAAEGHWSRVYRARPAGLPADRPADYALKTLRSDRVDDPVAIRLLGREAMVSRSVAHPHLIPVLDTHVGCEPRFVVMPWLKGTTLQSLLDAGRWIDLPTTLWIVRQAAEAMAALDEVGWMHGDVKPSNLFVSRRDRPIMGTGLYMAPEWLVPTLTPDVRSDIYSLGVILYEMLACRPPIGGRDFREVAVQHKQAAPLPLRRIAPHLPTELASLVQTMLAKDPLRRPQSPAEIVQRLVKLEILTFNERAA